MFLCVLVHTHLFVFLWFSSYSPMKIQIFRISTDILWKYKFPRSVRARATYAKPGSRARINFTSVTYEWGRQRFGTAHAKNAVTHYCLECQTNAYQFIIQIVSKTLYEHPSNYREIFYSDEMLSFTRNQHSFRTVRYPLNYCPNVSIFENNFPNPAAVAAVTFIFFFY